MIPAILVACSTPEEAEPQEKYRGCSATATLGWDSDDPNLESYVQEVVYDPYGWVTLDRYDSSFDSNDLTLTYVVRPDGQNTLTRWYFGNGDVVNYDLVASYGGDDLVDLEELYLRGAEEGTLVARSTYTNSEGALRSAVHEVEGSYTGGPLAFLRRDEYTYDDAGRATQIDQYFANDVAPSRFAVIDYLRDTEYLTGFHVLLSGSSWPVVSNEYEYDHQDRIVRWSERDESLRTAVEELYEYDGPGEAWDRAIYRYEDLLYEYVYQVDELAASWDDAGRMLRLDVVRTIGDTTATGELAVEWRCDGGGR